MAHAEIDSVLRGIQLTRELLELTRTLPMGTSQQTARVSRIHNAVIEVFQTTREVLQAEDDTRKESK